MKFLIVAAKTGGHVFPASVIGKELIKNNHDIVFIGTGSEIEKNAYDNLAKLYELQMEGFRGSNLIKKFQVLFQTFFNIFKAIQIINKEKIDAMIGFGGFITVPVGIACWITRKPIFTHEQNVVIGSANKLLSKISKINFHAFPFNHMYDAGRIPSGYWRGKSIFTGNPIRESFINHREEIDHPKYEDDLLSPKGLQARNEIRIYITGGSQGSEYINKYVPKIFNDFSNKIKIKHQCGKNNLHEVSDIYLKEDIDAEISEFYQNPVEQILWSDFVISRGGALSLSEVTSLRRGLVIIPLPNSVDNHQVENAKSIEKEGMGFMHEQKDHIDKLREKIKDIIENKIYLKWTYRKNNSHIGSSNKIIEQLENYLGKNETF
tara:strand:+ start:9361 stop:10491 length:1131 start_codon:yes stop_codon:yes gene_type:complete